MCWEAEVITLYPRHLFKCMAAAYSADDTDETADSSADEGEAPVTSVAVAGSPLTKLTDTLLIVVLSRVPLGSQTRMMKTCHRLLRIILSRAFRRERVATGCCERAIVRIGNPCFALISGKWREMPTPRECEQPMFAACVVASDPSGDTLMLVGGLSKGIDVRRGDREPLTQVLAYTNGLGWWRMPQLSDCLVPKGSLLQAACLSGRVVVFGGSTNFFHSDLREGVAMTISIEDKVWRRWPVRLPRPFAQVAIAANGSTLFVAGGACLSSTTQDGHVAAGVHANPPLDDLDVFDDVEKVWAKRRPMPARRRAAKGAFCKGSFYVVGGVDPDGNYTNTVFMYNLARDEWTEKASLPARETFGGARHLQQHQQFRGELLAHDDSLYFFPAISTEASSSEHDNDVDSRRRWRPPLVYLPSVDSWAQLPIQTNAPAGWKAEPWNETESYASLLMG